MSNSNERSYDVEAVRNDFPILLNKIYGKRFAYLDSGASAQKPQCVIDTMSEFYRTSYANVHRGLHYLSNAATDDYESARRRVARFICAQQDSEIIFTKNATEAVNLVAYSWGMANLKEGDEVVLSIMEHHSNLIPWHFIRERCGAKLVYLPVDDQGNFDINEFKAVLSEKTKLVAVTHMSNVLGTILPIKEIVALAHQLSIPVLVDGSQAAVHLSVDVQDLDCDWYVFTGHKVYGPTGIGVLFGKRDLLRAMQPFLGGGEMIEEVGLDTVSYNEPPHRFEAGTPPIVEAIGLASALDYFESVGGELAFQHEERLLAYAHERLSEFKSLRIFGQAKKKGPIISFDIAGIHAHDMATYLDRMGVAVRAGTHCAQPLLRRFGLTSTCRASLAMYTNRQDIDQFVEAVDKAIRFFND